MSGRYTGPLGKNDCYANCTPIMVRLLKAWKVTIVGIECDVAAFKHHVKKAWKVTVVGIECNCTAFLTRSTPEIFFQGFFQNSASKMANYTIIDIVNYLMLIRANC